MLDTIGCGSEVLDRKIARGEEEDTEGTCGVSDIALAVLRVCDWVEGK